MAETATKTNISEATRALRWGISAHDARLNERLGALSRRRWRPLADGSGLVAVDRRGREFADLYFREGEEGDRG